MPKSTTIVAPGFSRSVLDTMLGQIVAPVIDGKLILPELAPVGTPLDPKLARDMHKWLKGRVCAVCGRREGVEAHHLYPRHIWPQLAWMPEYWYPLCRGGALLECHCLIGHGGDYSGYCPYTIALAEMLRPIIRANKVLLAAIRNELKEVSP